MILTAIFAEIFLSKILLDKSIALNKLRSKNEFSIGFHCELRVSSKKYDWLWCEVQLGTIRNVLFSFHMI